MSRYKHLKSKFHKEFDECKHIIWTIKNPDKDEVDEIDT